jgi:hypothetical protein
LRACRAGEGERRREYHEQRDEREPQRGLRVGTATGQPLG